MIKIGGDYYIDADSSCFLLVEWDGSYGKPNEKGVSARQNVKVRYYSDLQSLFKAAHKVMMRKQIQESVDFADLKERIGRVNQIITDACQKITPEFKTEDSEGEPLADDAT